MLKAVVNINGTLYRVSIMESRMEPDDIFESLILVLIISFILLTTSLLLVVRRISRSIWNPFYANLEEVKRFSLKNTSMITLNSLALR